MTRTIIIGANGAMGQLLAEALTESGEFQVAAGIDLFPEARSNAFPVYASLEQCPVQADLLIDFSKPAALEDNLSYAKANRLPIIIATTGYSDAQKQAIAEAAKHIPVFFTANMSLGVNLQVALCKQAAGFFGDLAEIEIIEKHHHRKVDAPSGTALLLADSMNAAMDGKFHYRYGRGGNDCKRQPDEIGIHAIRGGNIVGEHEVEFITDQEILTITHHAENRKVFAIGAVRAAKFLLQQSAGLYSMEDLLAQNHVHKLKIEEDTTVITIRNAPFSIGYFARLQKALADEGIEVDLVSQSTAAQGRANISFSVLSGNAAAAEQIIHKSNANIDFMVLRDLCKYTVTCESDHFNSDQMTQFLSAMGSNFIDILLLSIVGNTMVFFTESDYRLQTGAILAKIFC